MKEIVVAKFEPLHEHVAEDTIIKVTGKVPDFPIDSFFENGRKFYDDQAEAIADALYNSLPQGTFDRLWVAIMRKKMSLYVGKTES